VGPRLQSDRAWWTAVIYVAAAAMLLRFYNLPLKPLHHDEGVNGFFLTALVRPPHTYRYDPANYHGPTLYYAAWLSTWLLRPPTFAIRFVPGAAGLLSVLLMLSFKRSIGVMGALAAASLLAVSPGAVYFSRYFIHEMLLVCFTIGIVAALVHWLHSGQALFLYLAAASAGLAFATKETAVISAIVLVAAAVGAAWLVEARENVRMGGRVSWPWQHRFIRSTYQRALGTLHGRGSRSALFVALGVFAAVNMLFYTSLLAHPRGVIDAVRALALWTNTGTTAHTHPWYTYLLWLSQEEMPLLLLGALGIALAFWKADNRFAVFAALWAVGIFTAYSVIPYKTPWLTLNILAPLAMSGGYAVDLAWRNRPYAGRVAVAGMFAAIVVFAAYQAVVLSFVRYDDDRYPYVYAHTSREVLALVGEVQRLEQQNSGLTIAVTSEHHFPLSWYFRGYSVGYYGQPIVTNDSLVIGSECQRAELDRLLGDRYVWIGSYRLRPGVRLVLYARRDVRRAGSTSQAGTGATGRPGE
jgi:uncharacterized protein (TIGR03663 family)